jgi:hypothetical protein
MISTSRVLIAAGLLVLTGAVHGLWTDRWKPSHRLEEATARLERVPMTIGDWQAIPLELTADEVEMAQLTGYLSRKYVNRYNGQHVFMVLMCGRPGPVGAHTPDICMQGAGFEMVGSPSVYNLPDSGDPPPQFELARFKRTDAAEGSHELVVWSWNADGTWKAPTNPRLTFARYRALYKLYLQFEMPSAEAKLEDDPRAEFVRQLMPELDRALFPANPGAP